MRKQNRSYYKFCESKRKNTNDEIIQITAVNSLTSSPRIITGECLYRNKKYFCTINFQTGETTIRPGGKINMSNKKISWSRKGFKDCQRLYQLLDNIEKKNKKKAEW